MQTMSFQMDFAPLSQADLLQRYEADPVMPSWAEFLRYEVEDSSTLNHADVMLRSLHNDIVARFLPIRVEWQPLDAATLAIYSSATHDVSGVVRAETLLMEDALILTATRLDAQGLVRLHSAPQRAVA